MSGDKLLAELSRRESRVSWSILDMFGESLVSYWHIAWRYTLAGTEYGAAYCLSEKSLREASSLDVVAGILAAKAQKAIARIEAGDAALED